MADTALEVREPAWLAARRSRAAELASSLDLPRFKGDTGWEFTSLRSLSLDAFSPAEPGSGDASAVESTRSVNRTLTTSTEAGPPFTGDGRIARP